MAHTTGGVERFRELSASRLRGAWHRGIEPALAGFNNNERTVLRTIYDRTLILKGGRELKGEHVFHETVERLAEACNVTKRTLERIVSQLKAKGWITSTARWMISKGKDLRVNHWGVGEELLARLAQYLGWQSEPGTANLADHAEDQMAVHGTDEMADHAAAVLADSYKEALSRFAPSSKTPSASTPGASAEQPSRKRDEQAKQPGTALTGKRPCPGQSAHRNKTLSKLEKASFQGLPALCQAFLELPHPQRQHWLMELNMRQMLKKGEAVRLAQQFGLHW